MPTSDGPREDQVCAFHRELSRKVKLQLQGLHQPARYQSRPQKEFLMGNLIAQIIQERVRCAQN